MSRFISADTATTASHAFRPSSSIHELSTYPAPSCSRFQGRRGSKEWTVATSLDPYVRFARAPAKFVYHVCVWTMSESIGSATMFMLKLRTSNAFATFGSGTPWGFKVGRYRRTAIPALSGGGPSSRVRTSTSMSFERDLAMYFAWTPAPPYTFGGNSHVKIVVFIARREPRAHTMKVPVRRPAVGRGPSLGGLGPSDSGAGCHQLEPALIASSLPRFPDIGGEWSPQPVGAHRESRPTFRRG